jgi:hypothetical protein
MKIIIETIDHADQRYNTCGDWQWEEDKVLTINVSKLPSPSYSESAAVLLIGVHELIEALLCSREGVYETEVDEFDLAQQSLSNPKYKEPGDDPKAPYHYQHLFASNIERLIAARLGINWQKYEEEIEKLG